MKTLLATFLFIGFFFPGCSYSGKVKDGQFELSDRVSRYQKFGWAVEFDEGRSTFDPIQGTTDGGRRSIDIETDGIESSVREAIFTMFESSSSEKSPEMVVEFDLRARSNSSQLASCSLHLKFIHPATRDDIFEYTKHVYLGNNEKPIGEAALAGATFGLSTVASPFITMAAGSEAKEKLEDGMSMFFAECHQRIEDNEALFRRRILAGFSEEITRNISPEPRTETTATEPVFTTPKPKSPYELFMRSVFVVNNEKGNLGTGFFIWEERCQRAYAITNAHVVEDSEKVTIRMHDGRTQTVKVIHTDISNDLAIIESPSGTHPSLPLMAGEDMTIGNELIAIGTPLGLDWTISRGVMSQIRPRRNGSAFVQTDVSINPGNSGGPLIDTKSGSVVGIATFRLTESDSGLNFGLHASTISDIVSAHCKNISERSGLNPERTDKQSETTTNSLLDEAAFLAAKDKLIDLYTSGAITKAEFDRKIEELRNRLSN